MLVLFSWILNNLSALHTACMERANLSYWFNILLSIVTLLMSVFNYWKKWAFNCGLRSIQRISINLNDFFGFLVGLTWLIIAHPLLVSSCNNQIFFLISWSSLFLILSFFCAIVTLEELVSLPQAGFRSYYVSQSIIITKHKHFLIWLWSECFVPLSISSFQNLSHHRPLCWCASNCLLSLSKRVNEVSSPWH